MSSHPEVKEDYALLRDADYPASTDDEHELSNPYSEPRAPRWRERFLVLLITSTAIIVLMMVGTGYYYHDIKSRSCPYTGPGVKSPWYPAPVKYVNKNLSAMEAGSDRFMGEPRPEMDQAWHELLAGSLIRFSEEEFEHGDIPTSIRHKEGGYVAALGVSHDLHCLKRIHQYMFRDYYREHGEWWGDDWEHVDHCLDSIRRSLLCNADVSLITLVWTTHNQEKASIVRPQQAACVDYNALQEWMMNRATTWDKTVKPPKEFWSGSERRGLKVDN